EEREIRECVVKVKFEDFQITSAQRPAESVVATDLRELLAEAWERGNGKSVRLIGAGVRFRPLPTNGVEQLVMF
ncbi:MAG: DNA polymerase IV, partial [Verrucomicrobiota bacterium]